LIIVVHIVTLSRYQGWYEESQCELYWPVQTRDSGL